MSHSLLSILPSMLHLANSNIYLIQLKNKQHHEKIKLFTLALAALFAGNVMAETEKNPADATKDIAIVGVSYTLGGDYVAGKGGAQAGTMTSKGIKFRINKTYGEIKNAVPFVVNEGYKITGISFDGQINDNTKTSVLGKILVDGTEIVFTSVTLPNKTSSIKFATGTIEAKKEVVLVFDGAASQANVEYTVTYEVAQVAIDDATLKSVTIDGEALEGFDPATETYNVELPFGTTAVPTVAAVTTSKKANAVVTPATTIPGATTIAVTAEDGTTTKTYTINFTTAASASTDATLSTITIDGKAIAGFKSDSMTYAYEVAYNYEAGKFPVVAAVANDESATIAYTQITAFPGKATILVTAQAGNTLTYTIDITKATAPKILSEVVFSNGAKGASLNGVVRVPYLAGTEVPTVVSAVAADGATAVVAEDKNSITVTGEDNTTLVYTIETVELALATLGTEEVTFTGEETYIFDPYGWDSSKGWKFAKTVEDAENRRVSEGRTRIYMALPAAKEVILTSGTGGARAIKVFVNGVEKTEIASTAKSGETITIALDSKNANFLAVESNQTKGDGGFTKIKLVPAGETAIDNAVVAEKAQKMIIDGQLVIVKDNVRYNAQGICL